MHSKAKKVFLAYCARLKWSSTVMNVPGIRCNHGDNENIGIRILEYIFLD